MNHSNEQRQLGYSLIEVSTVAAILLMIAVVGVPAIQDYVIESRVPKLAEELQRFAARARIQGMVSGTAPYSGFNTSALAEAMRDSSVLSVAGDTVRHGLGDGLVTLASTNRSGGAAGSAFVLTLNGVHRAACPGLATALHGMASRISVQGRAGAVLVKNADTSPPSPYDPARAAAQCASGNTFVFTFQ